MLSPIRSDLLEERLFISHMSSVIFFCRLHFSSAGNGKHTPGYGPAKWVPQEQCVGNLQDLCSLAMSTTCGIPLPVVLKKVAKRAPR